jgi:hypothetical protein
MSLHTAAKNLSSKGRGRDTLLVHMSPREVQGLQALAKSKGGSLTINPETGLVEAGFLEQVLPVVAAAAATYFTAGAAAPALSAALGSSAAGGILAGAGAGALIGGGSAALQGKDVGQAALMGGVGGAISGGLGAYSPAEAAIPTTAGATQQAATQAGSQAIGGAATTPASTGIDPALLEGMSKEQVLAQAAPAPVTPQQLSQGVSQGVYTPQQAAQYGKAYSGVYSQPTPGSDFYVTSNPLTKTGILALPGLGAAAGENYNPPGSEQYDENSPYRMRLSNNFQGSTPVRPNPYYRATYAQGGLASLQGNMYPQGQQDATQFATPTQMPTSAEVVRSDYDAPTNPYNGEMMRMKKGGIADLGGYSDGGRMLKGPGDGMSDSIPGVIGRRQPARLADGEFVVPADVVSHLGNGSTDAGAKKLYAMMAKVRQARTGKKKQAPAVKANRYMPA